jgi:hypothetical protein
MAGTDADIWVCGECRSVNNLRSRQCYRCRTPRDVAAVDPSEVEGTGHGKLREVALPEFRPSRRAALLASALLIFLPVMQIVSTIADALLFGRILRDPALLNDPAFGQSVESLVAGSIALATLGVALLALTGWAFWLSRVVVAMPALGLGYPPTDGLMAFVENFLPGLNLFRVPAIVRDVIRRLDPESIRHEALIFVAWIGLLGGYLTPRFTVYLEWFGSGTLEEAVQETLVVQTIATAMVVVGATFLVVLIWWIEKRIVRRRAAQLAGEPAPVAARHVAGAPGAGLVAAAAGAGLVAEAPPGSTRSITDAAAAIGVAAAAAPTRPAAPDLYRPITAATGAASVSGQLEAPSTLAVEPEMSTAPPPVEPGPARSTSALPLEATPTGPRLHLRVESGAKMIATLDGASEPITLTELHAAAAALARANGSAVIMPAAASFEARSLATEALEVFKDARVPATLEEG